MYAEMGAPIRDAFILVQSGSGKGDVTAALDEQGRFRLPITAGFYDVEERRATPLCGREHNQLLLGMWPVCEIHTRRE